MPTRLRRVVRLVAQGRYLDRLEALAERHPVHVGTLDVGLLAVRVWRRVVDTRVTGLAAEMTYYALISLLPLLTAVGAALGFTERFLGTARVTRIEEAVVDGLSAVFADQVTTDVVGPLVRGLLRQERAGVAVGGVLVALWLASRMFRAAIRALDDAYAVPERRSLLQQWGLGLLLALGAVVTLVVVLAVVVVGPLLGGGVDLAEQLGRGDAYRAVWDEIRWLVVVPVSLGFLLVLHRYGPNVRLRWRACLPGALVGTAGVLAVAVGFRAYLAAVGLDAPDSAGGGAAVRAAGQVVGMVLAGVLWLWLSSITILLGGVVNAEVARLRGERPARRR